MKILRTWPSVDGIVRYLLRDGYGEIAVDVDGEAMTGFTYPGYKGDEEKALKKAFRFLE
jgi:hypothetical protein